METVLFLCFREKNTLVKNIMLAFAKGFSKKNPE